jgi:potassium-transporting ATPase ATP-binding subunit
MTVMAFDERDRKAARWRELFSAPLALAAARHSFVMLRPDIQWQNPVMFVVEVGAALTLVYILRALVGGSAGPFSIGYFVALDFWLWLTVLLANFATAFAEERGRAQAAVLRRTRVSTPARRIRADGRAERVTSIDLAPGDVILVETGEVIPGDGEVIDGAATVDESAITGESAPVIREAGGDRSGVTGGTTVLSDQLRVRIVAGFGESFLDRMIALVEGAVRQRTPNEIALTLVLTAFSLIFMIVVVPLWPMAYNAEVYMTSYLGLSKQLQSLGTDVPTLIALVVCLIPTTIGALLAAIGIAGMDRALRANIIAKSGRAVETAGDIDTVLLDKTGTITLGARRASAFLPLDGVELRELHTTAALASAGDRTPEGQSIVTTVLAAGVPEAEVTPPDGSETIEFSAQTRMSGIDLPGGRQIRKGAPDAVIGHLHALGAPARAGIDGLITNAAAEGATPLVVADGKRALGVVVLQDTLKPNINLRIGLLRQMGLRTIMITGDNRLTAATIAQRAGVDDFLAEATPETKLQFLRREQAEGKLVAMMGDGTNDAPALAQADVGLAMNSGTQAAKEAGNMVDLDSDPTKLIEVVEIGKELLMTRGALTTFSIANDVAKYFAIVPALFAGTLPWLGALNIMHLHSPTSAILSAVIFNALIIPLLIPVALKGVRYRPIGADALLRRNLLVWGVGGVIAPFLGIKLIDMIMTALHLVA